MSTGRPRELPASVGQRLLWFLDRHRGGHGALNCPMIARLDGPVDPAALHEALRALTDRHEALRTRVVRRGRAVHQVIDPPGADPDGPEVTAVDLRGEPDPDAAADAALTAELRTSTDAATRPVRIRLWRTGASAWLLCLTLHHTVTDTWSCDVLFRDLAEAYGAVVDGRPAAPRAGWQYSQFTAWQERRFARGALERHQQYWREQLAGAAPPRMPFPVLGPEAATGGRTTVVEELPAPVARELAVIARRHRATTFTVLLSVYYALLARQTGVADVAVSTLLANRTRPELLETVGFLTTMVVLRTRLPADGDFGALVERTHDVVTDAIAHQELPFHALSRGDSTGGVLRLDDVVFQMLAEPIDQHRSAGGVEFEGVVPDVTGRFDLELALMGTHSGGFAVKFYYPPGRVSDEDARRFLCDYIALATEVAARPDLRPLGPRTALAGDRT